MRVPGRGTEETRRRNRTEHRGRMGTTSWNSDEGRHGCQARDPKHPAAAPGETPGPLSAAAGPASAETATTAVGAPPVACRRSPDLCRAERFEPHPNLVCRLLLEKKKKNL